MFISTYFHFNSIEKTDEFFKWNFYKGLYELGGILTDKSDRNHLFIPYEKQLDAVFDGH